MNDKLTKYLDEVFVSYEGTKSINDLKADLLSDLQERYRDLKAEGMDDEKAFEMTVDSIGDIEQTVQEVANLTHSLERQVLTNFSGSNLPESDFAGVTVHKGKFSGSALRGSDFSGADLTGSSFISSDVREGNFDGANLTDCNFRTLDLTNASFNKSILIRTDFSTSGLDNAKFINVQLTDVKLSMTDLRKTLFKNCIFTGVDFKYTDLRGVCFDGLIFNSVRFDKAALNETSFKGATLKNVSFIPTFTITNKYYRAIKTISFGGARIDKLTYASLKGMGADLSDVTII